jgi:hypothetical protein
MMSARSSNVAPSRLRSRSCRISSRSADSSKLERGGLPARFRSRSISCQGRSDSVPAGRSKAVPLNAQA